jgi:hypothetical protein
MFSPRVVLKDVVKIANAAQSPTAGERGTTGPYIHGQAM